MKHCDTSVRAGDKLIKYISLTVKLLIVIFSLTGIYMNLYLPGRPHPNWSSLLYFTIQSNLWIAIVCLVGAVLMIRNVTPGRTLSVIKQMFTISITLTGFVYCFILAPTFHGNAFKTDSILVHVLVPSLSILDFILCSRRYKLYFKDAGWAMLPPLYYFVFASVGYVLNWNFGYGSNYPYFFLNWGSPLGAFGLSSNFPFMGVVWYVIITLIILYLISLLFILVNKLLAKLKW